MEQNKKPVAQYYYSEQEWARLGCGPLPEERNTLITTNSQENSSGVKQAINIGSQRK